MIQTRIAIIGMGLIGASLALAFKKHFAESIWIYAVDNNSTSIQQAIQHKIADSGTVDPVLGVADADVIFVCTPVMQIVPIIKKILPHVKPGTIITDTGSTKKVIVQEMTTLLPKNIYYVGGHPMAGREKSGISAADENLFRGKRYIIIENSHSVPQAVNQVCLLLEATGAKINVMDAGDHDVCAAMISHVPHVAAAALVNLLACYSQPKSFSKLAGGGFLDTTRIASSNPDMWADICMTNDEAMLQTLTHLQNIISDTMDAIHNQDRQKIYKFFHQAKECRDALLKDMGKDI